MSYHNKTARSTSANIRPGAIQHRVANVDCLVIDDHGVMSVDVGSGRLVRCVGVPYVDGAGVQQIQNDLTARIVDPV